jgi:hypothetical protein
VVVGKELQQKAARNRETGLCLEREEERSGVDEHLLSLAAKIENGEKDRTVCTTAE